jgi:hypothetical protein
MQAESSVLGTGLMGVALLFTKGWEIRHGSPQNLNEDQSPLIHGENEVHIPTQAPAEGLDTDTTPSAPPVSVGVDGLQREVANVPEDQLCTICLDARKDSFFDPCGHRCTCYSCGMRYFSVPSEWFCFFQFIAFLFFNIRYKSFIKIILAPQESACIVKIFSCLSVWCHSSRFYCNIDLFDIFCSTLYWHFPIRTTLNMIFIVTNSNCLTQ